MYFCLSLKINNDKRRIYSSETQIKFKTSMIKSCLCNYRDAYILDKRNMLITSTRADAAASKSHN